MSGGFTKERVGWLLQIRCRLDSTLYPPCLPERWETVYKYGNPNWPEGFIIGGMKEYPDGTSFFNLEYLHVFNQGKGIGTEMMKEIADLEKFKEMLYLSVAHLEFWHSIRKMYEERGIVSFQPGEKRRLSIKSK